MAMYRAKELTRNAYCFFTAEMNQRSVAKLQLNTDLRRAIERGEFVLHYQPKVDLRNGRIHGVEALLRWKHPQRGMVPPAEFVPALEDSGLILPVGEWVLGEAARQLGVSVVASASLHQGQLTRLPPVMTEYIPGLSTDAQRAVQFVRSTPGIATALVGMKTPAHVDENATIGSVEPMAWERFQRLFSAATA